MTGLRRGRWKERVARLEARPARRPRSSWSAGRKKQVVLRRLRGEPVDAISRELAVPGWRLEEWHDRALAGIEVGLKEREDDPVEKPLDEASRRIGERIMEVGILRQERQVQRPWVGRRSSR